MNEKIKKIAIVIGLVVTSIALGIIMPAHGSTTQAPANTCQYTGTAGAGTPYQIAGSPPQVVYKGTTYCNGGSFYREWTDTSLYVDGGWWNEISIKCNPGVDPCHANGQVTKLRGCHNYQTRVESAFQPTSGYGDLWFGIENNVSWSNVWHGCR